MCIRYGPHWLKFFTGFTKYLTTGIFRKFTEHQWNEWPESDFSIVLVPKKNELMQYAFWDRWQHNLLWIAQKVFTISYIADRINSGILDKMLEAKIICSSNNIYYMMFSFPQRNQERIAKLTNCWLRNGEYRHYLPRGWKHVR